MSYTLFISDLHLSPTRQDLVKGFVEFCRNDVAKNADVIYILGDFVEYWIGDDTPTTGLEVAFKELKKLSISGVKLYFQHGNRDFLIADKFAKRYNIELLDDHVVIDLYGNKTLLLHGDTLCTDDQDYQDFREMVRSEDWQKNVLSKSLYGRIEYASSLRKKTQEAVKEKSSEIMDVNQETVLNTFDEYKVKHMIHGHTHRPAEHLQQKNDDTLSRVVLSDWGSQGQYYQVHDDGKTQFVYFDIKTVNVLKSFLVKCRLMITLLRLYMKK